MDGLGQKEQLRLQALLISMYARFITGIYDGSGIKHSRKSLHFSLNQFFRELFKMICKDRSRHRRIPYAGECRWSSGILDYRINGMMESERTAMQRSKNPAIDPTPNSLEDAMEQFQSSLLRYATRVLNNEDAAQDVVQETFIRLNGNLDRIAERGVQLKGWLFRTTHNAAVDYIRKESRRRNLHERQSKQADLFVNDPEAQQQRDEKQAMVMQHLNTLKPKEREVLVLRLQEGMSYKEIAGVLKRSEGYVGTLIHTATKKLSQSLQQAGVVS
jgi:RNA polymerase sigma-70 factor (ECF subfamily)